MALAASAGGGAVGGTTGSAAMSAAESAVVRNVQSNLSKAKRDVRRGKPGQAWRRLGLRKGANNTLDAVECASLSFGEVQDFFARHPCRSMRRVQFPVSYEGGRIWVLVSEVRMRSASEARRFTALIDRHGTGDTRPVLPTVEFTGHNYDSDQQRRTVFVAESEPASGAAPEQLLEATAKAAAELAPRVT
ncbi:hypothetical protein [Saccharopolyspora griseoalba]|uniref:Secreted protein n=1 Tax=Saccharopolyspora griseoalba TaxID=1431848 RepID=A0ABW2LS86_9PSEU